MIPQAAIDDFLDGPRDDHRWLKRLTHAEVDKVLAGFDPPPRLYEKLGLHQKVSVALGIAYPRFSFWLDMGAGKTLITLELLQYFYEIGVLRRALIFVRSDKAFPTWEKQIKQYGIRMPVITLEGGSAQKWKMLEAFGKGLILVSYPSAVAMTCRRKGDFHEPSVRRLAKTVDAVVMDESTTAGNLHSLTHRLMKRLTPRVKVKIVYALAGRPFGRDPMMLWVQQDIVDRGESLGDTLGLFREAFYKATKNRWDPDERKMDYVFRKKMKPDLTRLIQHRSITYSSDECVDLPAIRSMIEEVTFGPELRDYYRDILQQAQAAKGNFREIKNAFVRMRQLSSGFLGFKDDETGEKAEIAFAENPKLERQLELLSELPVGRKAVVFYEFTYSGRLLSKELTAAKIGNIWLWSGAKDYRGLLDSFMTDPEYQVAVINNRIGAYSLDGLQEVANYLFFYESPVPVIDRDQARRRILRQGQPRKVFEYDLVVRNTMDQRILDFHREGRDLYKSVLKDPALMY